MNRTSNFSAYNMLYPISPAEQKANMERASFVAELKKWEHAANGENRKATAEYTLKVYNQSLHSSKVELEICGAITECPPLPPKLTHLHMGYSKVAALPKNLPDGLVFLQIRETEITALPTNLPAGLVDLDIQNSKVMALPENLPFNLQNLNIAYTQVAKLPKSLPDGLLYLRIEHTPTETLPDNLPARLKSLIISHTLVSKLPDLPSDLHWLDLSHTEVSELPALPKNLDTLKISYTKVKELPALPALLTDLDISHSLIAELPANLPIFLRTLDISDTSVAALPAELSSRLRFLDISNTSVTALPAVLPARLDIDMSNTPLQVQRYMESVEQNPDSDSFSTSTAIWDNHVAQAIQTTAIEHQNLYNAAGGIKEKFENQEPSKQQIDEINSYINTKLTVLMSDNGVSVGVISLKLPNGTDSYSFADFNSDEKLEWCLLSHGGNKFSFITVITAKNMIEMGNTHPITREPLTETDFIRGQAILDLLKA